jgi:N-formylglutamate amidohydrolase
VILSVPHAGRDYPAALLRDELRLPMSRRCGRWRIAMPTCLSTTLVGAGLRDDSGRSRRPRAWIDLNRNARPSVDPRYRSIPRCPARIR